jgi:hypothetical protein
VQDIDLSPTNKIKVGNIWCDYRALNKSTSRGVPRPVLIIALSGEELDVATEVSVLNGDGRRENDELSLCYNNKSDWNLLANLTQHG